MRSLGIQVFWAAFALAVLCGVMVAPSLGAAAWQGLQIETSISIDTKQARSEVVLDLAPSAFAFDPVVVTISDKPKKATKTIGLQIKLKNNSDKDYYVYATATLLDADGKAIASDSGKAKADDHDSARVGLKFKLPYADIERMKTCALRFAFEKE